MPTSPSHTPLGVTGTWQNAIPAEGAGPSKGPVGQAANPYAELNQRVERVFSRIARAYPAASPRFVVAAETQPQISWGTRGQIVISSGLIQRCPTDDILAGVLALAWTEWLRHPLSSGSENYREPPDLRIGPESNTYGELPLLRQAELAKTGHANHSARPPRPGAPETLARQTCERAGFTANAFDQARAIYYQARRN
ncbi:hypothetical protein HRbin36_01312 [bacterium HR36]|nr:hypothetical protein HRbin36_01312 [bacterium HR36]